MPAHRNVEISGDQVTPDAEMIPAWMTAKQRFRSAAARFLFSEPPVRYHHPGKPGLVPETIPVNPRSRFDELPAPTQQAIAQLDDPQVRPCCWPKAQYASGDVGGGSAGIRCASNTAAAAGEREKPAPQ